MKKDISSTNSRKSYHRIIIEKAPSTTTVLAYRSPYGPVDYEECGSRPCRLVVSYLNGKRSRQTDILNHR